MSSVAGVETTDGAGKQLWWFRAGAIAQGPFVFETMQQFCLNESIAPTTLVSPDGRNSWSVAASFRELWGFEEPEPGEIGRWQVARAENPDSDSFDFATLQMYAAQGWLRTRDLVRELPDGTWQSAENVTGLFAGRRQWCIRCGLQLTDYDRCHGCGAEQPDYDKTDSTPSLILGWSGMLLYVAGMVLAFFAITGEWTVMDARVDEHYPEVFSLLLVLPLGISAMAMFLGFYAQSAICKGRDSPQFLRRAIWGSRLGISTTILIGLTVVAVVAFSVRHFW